ncbi:hypothetical protein [Nonomuraea sp. NPDC049784]
MTGSGVAASVGPERKVQLASIRCDLSETAEQLDGLVDDRAKVA